MDLEMGDTRPVSSEAYRAQVEDTGCTDKKISFTVLGIFCLMAAGLCTYASLVGLDGVGTWCHDKADATPGPCEQDRTDRLFNEGVQLGGILALFAGCWMIQKVWDRPHEARSREDVPSI